MEKKTNNQTIKELKAFISIMYVRGETGENDMSLTDL